MYNQPQKILNAPYNYTYNNLNLNNKYPNLIPKQNYQGQHIFNNNNLIQNYNHANLVTKKTFPGQYNNNLNLYNINPNLVQKQNYPGQINNNLNLNNINPNLVQKQNYPGQFNNNLNQNYINQNLPLNKAKTLNQEKVDDEAYIDKLKGEKNKDLGFDLSLLKRDELNVNLIHFDMNITSKENYIYYNKFKVDVVGGYIAIDNFNVLKKYLEAVKNKDIPFIVLCSGFNGKEVIPICKKYPFIKEVIIFCGNVNKYKHYLTQYPGYVKNIFVDIRQVYNYIKYLGPMNDQGIREFKNSDNLIFSHKNIQMDKQLDLCPVISAYE